MERDKGNTETTTVKADIKATPSLEEVLKQYNLEGLDNITPSSLATTYGTSNDAILAALLKEQGIGPSTPKGLDKAKVSPLIHNCLIIYCNAEHK